MAANDHQVGAEHYGLKDYQHWDIVWQFKLDYFQGQIIKYVMRWRDKNGMEDLKKARHFLDKYMELINEGEATPAYVDQDGESNANS